MNVRGGLRLRLGQLSHLRALPHLWYNSDTAPTRTHGILKDSPKQSVRTESGYRHFSNTAIRMSDPQKWTAQVVRQTFFEYFEKKGHTIGT
jgi:hypothetical protein